jgi:DNA-binding transcriptional LysR family regulator
MLDLRRLRLLRELSRLGTVTAVADSLAYSPSAVSQQLAALEKETGVKLLVPSGRRVRLTREATVLVEHTELLLEQMERAEAAMLQARETVSGTVRVAAFQTAVLTLLPSAILALNLRHPALRIELTELEPELATPALVSGHFDVVIGEEYPGHPLPVARETERETLMIDELRLVTPTVWPERSLRALELRPFVLEPRGTTAHEWALAMCRAGGFEPDARYTTTDLQIHLELVAAGLAAALLPDLAGAANRTGVSVRTLAGRPGRQLFTLVRRGASTHPAIAALSAELRRS